MTWCNIDSLVQPTNYVHQAKCSCRSSNNSCNGRDGGGGGSGGGRGGSSSNSMVVLVATDRSHFTHACAFDY